MIDVAPSKCHYAFHKMVSCDRQAWPDLFLGGGEPSPASRKPKTRKAKPERSWAQDTASKSVYHGVEPALWQVVLSQLGRIGLEFPRFAPTPSGQFT